MQGPRSLLKAGCDAIKDGATFLGVFKQTLKPTVMSLLTATAEQVANRFATKSPNDAPKLGLLNNTYTVLQVKTNSRKQKSHNMTKKLDKTII